MSVPMVSAGAPEVERDQVSPSPKPGAGAVRRKRPSWGRKQRLIGLAAVAPALIIVLGVMVYPVVFDLYISLNKSNGVSYVWRGLGNYLDLVADPIVQGVFLTNLKFLISVPLVVFAAILVSVLLFERVRGWKFFRVVFFIPSVLSAAVIGIMFKSTFGYNGPVNALITAVGGHPINFFSNANLAISVIVLALVWSGFGYQALIVLSGLTAIDPAVFEAAAVDGAGWWKRLWHITLPNIRRVLGFVFIINILYTFSALFGFIFVMTAGGPGYDTTTLDYLIYLKAFSGSDLGSGAALAVLVFLLIGLLTILQVKVFKVSEED
ncbi:sugar ABC transporter permease [Diaminobutyricibacter tongyongensis]|uniref:Sugar ABC transporter permease n=1 Tax=Leifsonia tongyongensis TaxID=1268043 RepID=A0A6L9XUI4_9MICO|nr:sugar ABC transporter permease [Diaminobutyricibacter tongyongensis]NEN04744.1 sugar ABC transporter permease [Diaminobutyricibacter tongyongensis]